MNFSPLAKIPCEDLLGLYLFPSLWFLVTLLLINVEIFFFLRSLGSTPVGVSCTANHLLPVRPVFCQRGEVMRKRPTPDLDIVHPLS